MYIGLLRRQKEMVSPFLCPTQTSNGGCKMFCVIKGHMKLYFQEHEGSALNNHARDKHEGEEKPKFCHENP